MSVMMRRPATQAGFTIVELLIVIVVIAILAAISMVAYNGIQARANDSKTVAAVNQIEKALRLYTTQNGSTILGGFGSTAVASGSPCVDGASGFFGSGSYACTVEDTLVANNLLPSGFTASMPTNTYFTATSMRSVMLYACGSNGSYALYWTLRNPSAAEGTNLDNILASCIHTTQIRDSWGMRAGKIIQL